MARSSSRGRRAVAADALRSSPAADDSTAAPSLAAATLPRVWQGVGYQPLADPDPARRLFDFAAVAWPAGAVALAWGATPGDELGGALLGERTGTAMMFHGPVVVSERDGLEVAAQLVAAGLDHARALGIETVFARPLGLDRIWVRFGFIPVPEGALPRDFGRPPGVGLYAWRGGSALWTFRERPGD